MAFPSPQFRSAIFAPLAIALGMVAVVIRPHVCSAAADYKLEILAYSPDYPVDPMGTARSFGPPQINDLGQVLFLASWGLQGQQIVLYLGRPGAVNGIARYRDAAPEYGGEFLFFNQSHLNSRGETLFQATMGFVVPRAEQLPHREVIWRDASAIALQKNPFTTNHSDLAPAGVSGAPYTGTGRLQYPSNALMTPLFFADNGTGYHSGALEAAEGGAVVSVATKCLILSNNLTRRLIWYDGAPAPGLNGDFVFIADAISGNVAIPLTFGKKNGAFVGRTTVRPRGSNNTADNKVVYYQFANDALAPFYVVGDPLPGGLPTPMELFGDDNATEPYTVQYSGAQIADESGNTIIEAQAFSFDGTQSRLIGVWKKLPTGLVEVFRYDRDYPVDGGMVKFSGAGTYELGIDKKYAAMANGRLAFWMHYTGLGQTNVGGAALFRENEEGEFDLVAKDDMIAIDTNYRFTGLDGLRHQVLLMNGQGEIAFHGGVSDGGALVNAPSLWMVDRLGVLRHIVHKGQTITIGTATRTIQDFYLPNVALGGSLFPYTPDTARIFNDHGALVFTVLFTDNTRAIIRAVPDGYVEPPLPGRDFWFNNAKGDNNWHTTGGNPSTNWEDLDETPRSNAPGDVDINTAVVFIPEEFSVVLDARPAAVGTLQLDGSLTLREALTVNYDSPLANLRVEGPNGALNVINGAIANAPNTDWIDGTLTLSGPVLPGVFRNTGEFRAGGGSVEKLDDNVAFRNDGRFVATADSEFTVNVPFEAAGTTPAQSRTVRVEPLAKLNLLGGGTLGGGAGKTQDIEVSGLSTLTLAGEFDVIGHANFKPASAADDGVLRLGTPDVGVDLDVQAGSRVTFGLRGNSTHLERGQIRGDDGSVRNEGTFVWAGGRIDVGRPGGQSFTNSGQFQIGPGTAAPFQFDGYFVNASQQITEGMVKQSATLELTGVVENKGDWLIDGGDGILAPGDMGLVQNDGHLQIDPATAGTINIDAVLDNGPSASDPLGGLLRVGKLGQPDDPPAVQLRLRGPVNNLEGLHLAGGGWTVERNCTLTFPTDIESIGLNTVVTINAGQIPALNLKEIEGALLLTDTNLSSSSVGLILKRVPRSAGPQAELRVYGESTFTVRGNFENDAKIDCGPGAKIVVNGDMDNHSHSLVIIDGELEVNGVLFSDNEILSEEGGTIRAQQLNTFGSFSIGASPGSLTVIANTTFASTTQLMMEVAGTQPEDYDRLLITGNLALAGTLIVPRLDDFQPAPTDVFPVVQATAISGAFANVTSGQRLTVSDGSGSFQVLYGEGSPHGAGNIVLTNWQPAGSGAPTVTTQPTTQSIVAGSPLTLSITAAGAGALTYQWRYRGADIAGATASTYTVPSAQEQHAGVYSAVVSNATGTVYSAFASITVDGPPASSARLLNLSTRGLAQSGDNVLIPGFVIDGSANKKLLIRAVGPTLAQDPFKLAGTLPDPRMRLLKRNTTSGVFEEIASNDDWGTNTNAPEITSTAAQLFAFAFKDAKESALLMDLAPGQYTAIAGDKNGTSGVGIVELYDADADGAGSRLINISNRGFCGVGSQVMIPGFVISAEGPKTVLVRVVGPGLNQFGVTGTMEDPKLDIFPGGAATPILANDNWGDNPDAANTAAVAKQVSAFPLASGSNDAAFVVTLAPGVYTVVGASATAAGTGVVLVEVYVVP